MKKIFLLIFSMLTFSSLVSFSQNLIPNGDFELGPNRSSVAWFYGVDSTCSIIDTVLGPEFWTVVAATPDRLVVGDIPSTCWDDIPAQSGISYINNQHYDGIKATLLSPLEKDSTYKLSYYVAIETYGGIVPVQPYRFYFKFSNTIDSILSPFITNIAWKYIDTVFIPSANSTEIELWGSENVQCGTKIDNIRLEKITPNSINIYSKINNLLIYPNPATDRVFFSHNFNFINKIEICDITGNKIMGYNKSDLINNYIDLPLPDGTYILQIKINEDIIIKKVITLVN